MKFFLVTIMISVVIPLYNKAHTIKKTLDCVLRQTYRDYEIVIVDDGSNDNGVQLINEKYQDSQIRIISQKIKVSVLHVILV